jgi:hypothetical protein
LQLREDDVDGDATLALHEAALNEMKKSQIEDKIEMWAERVRAFIAHDIVRPIVDQVRHLSGIYLSVAIYIIAMIGDVQKEKIYSPIRL